MISIIKQIDIYFSLLEKKSNNLVVKNSENEFISASKNFILQNKKEDLGLVLNTTTVQKKTKLEVFLKKENINSFLFEVNKLKTELIEIHKEIEEKVKNIVNSITNLDKVILQNQLDSLLSEILSGQFDTNKVLKEDSIYIFILSRLSEEKISTIVSLNKDSKLRRNKIISDFISFSF